MPDKSRRKGARAELEAAELLGAEKISRAYTPGPDLRMPDGRYVEVKIRGKGGWSAAELYKWLDDDVQMVVVRKDRHEFLVCMTLTTFLDIQDEAKQ